MRPYKTETGECTCIIGQAKPSLNTLQFSKITYTAPVDLSNGRVDRSKYLFHLSNNSQKYFMS